MKTKCFLKWKENTHHTGTIFMCIQIGGYKKHKSRNQLLSSMIIITRCLNVNLIKRRNRSPQDVLVYGFDKQLGPMILIFNPVLVMVKMYLYTQN